MFWLLFFLVGFLPDLWVHTKYILYVNFLEIFSAVF